MTDVPLTPQRKVTYVFVSSTSSLKIPYAVAVNGKVLPDFAQGPKRVAAAKGKFTVTVDAGSKVALYLNSDAALAYRSTLVYEVSAKDRDVQVTVKEKAGKHKDSDKPALKAAAKDAKEPPQLDEYTAPLTGDIWMKVSHKYTAAEADALMPKGTGAEVIAAVKSIYHGLKTQALSIGVPAKGDKAAMTTQSRVRRLGEPPQQHHGLFAVDRWVAARSSGWVRRVVQCSHRQRHRFAQGDLVLAAHAGLHRAPCGAGAGRELRRQDPHEPGGAAQRGGQRNDQDNVSDAEVEAFKAYEAAIVDKKKADTELLEAGKAMKKPDMDTKAKAAAAERYKAADGSLKEATKKRDKARGRWNTERDEAEPATVKLFRTSLLQCTCVAQLFDPWFMDGNTHDKSEPAPNLQQGASTSNERLHAHHLHVTVHKPKIL